MVGSRRKGSKVKPKALNLMPVEEPVPLNIINVDAAVSPPHEESKKNDILDPDISPMFGDWIEDQMTDELIDEEQAKEYEINDLLVDKNEAVLAHVDTLEEYVTDEIDASINEDVGNSDTLEYVTDGIGAPINEDVGNSDKEMVQEEPDEDMSSGGDTGTNVDVMNSNDGTYEEVAEEEAEEDEEEEAEEEEEEEEEEEDEGEEGERETGAVDEEIEEEVRDGGDAVTIMDVEGSNKDKTNEVETKKAEELVSCGSDNEDEHADEDEEEEDEAEEEEDVSDEGDAVPYMDVENGDETANEEETEVDEEDVTETLRNISQVENSTVNLENDKGKIEQTAEDPIIATAEHAEDESVKEIATTITEVETGTEKVVLPRKKIIRKRLIKKKIPLSKGVTATNGTKLHSSDKLGEVSERGKTGNLNNGGKQGKPTLKIVKNIITKKKPQGQSGTQKGNVVQKPVPGNDESSIKDNQTIKHETKNDEAGNSIARSSRLKNRKGEKDLDKPGSSKKGKLTKKVDSKGMIFMCTSATKKDCYKYKVFGLPAGKKDIVSKIYRGMRLFLYDVDSKTLHGMYKAAGPGGFNVEPRAFKSQFPSQVRFSVLQNCLPLPEEKFKKVIKDNYYSRNKFNCELTGDQARNLCKLFSETTKNSGSRYPLPTPRSVTTSSTQLDRKRKWAEGSRRVRPEPISSREQEGRRKRRRSPIVRDGDERKHRRSPIVRDREEIRRVHVVRDREEVRYRQPVVIYDRESYLPPVEPLPLYQSFREDDPPRSRIYYEREPEVDTYRREPAIEYRDQEISGSRQNLRDPYEVAYMESRVYHEPVYERNIRRQGDYGFSSPEGRYAEYYLSDDHRPPVTLRRRH